MTDHTQTPTQSRRRATEAVSSSMGSRSNRSGLGWVWIGFIALGLVGVLFVGNWSQQERLSVGRTATVVADAQTSMIALSSHAEGLERGEAGAFTKMQTAKNELSSALNTLKSGGYAAAGDPVPVLPLANRSNVPLSAVEQSLAQFDQSSRILVENAGLLEKAGAAEAAFAPALASVSAGVANLARLPSFSQGVWMDGIQPLRAEWTRPELQTMAIVFAPMEGAAELQRQWSQRFKSQSDEIARLSAAASRDSRVSAADKAALAEFAKNVATVASSSSVLAEATPVRLKVKASRSEWKTPLTSGQASLEQVGSFVFAMAKGRGMGSYVAWFMGLLGIIGLILLARDWASKQRTATLVSQESVVVQHGQEQIDQVIRQLRRIVPGDAPIQKGMRLHEDAESAAFPLAMMINRILDTFENAEEDIKIQASNIDLGLATGLEAGTNLATQSQRHRQSIVQVETSVMDLAKQAASLAKRGTALQATLAAASEHMQNTATTMQQGIFKGDALRDNTQDSAKRIKRLSESAQAISMSVDLIYAVIEQVQVLSMNVAIEAANAGEQGRNFVVISQEIQRLVSKGTSAAREIDKVIEVILTDAKETVAAMEQGTFEVVESGKLSSKAFAALRDAEKELSAALVEVPKLGKDLERHAVSGAGIVEQVQGVGKNIGQTITDAVKAQETFTGMRAAAAKIIRFIEQGGSRNIWRKD
jgi:twitching motility protein PilJ